MMTYLTKLYVFSWLHGTFSVSTLPSYKSEQQQQTQFSICYLETLFLCSASLLDYSNENFMVTSAFPATSDFQCSLQQCLNQSPKLPVGVHGTGPCLVSQSGAGLQNVFGDLRTCASWAFVWVGNFQFVEVREELTVSNAKQNGHQLT